MVNNILKLSGVVKKFGGLTALDNLNLLVKEGSIHAIIGPNGSGKTTSFNVVTGLYPSNAGKMEFNNQDISRMLPLEITGLGMARTFQTLFLFKEMTVIENVLIGLQCRSRYSIWNYLRVDSRKTEYEKKMLEKAEELLDFVGIYQEKENIAKNLPYGKQRLLEIARALGTRPKLVLLDEPAAGMNPQEAMKLVETVKQIREKLNVTVLIIEHNMRLVMNLAEKITVLDHGAKIAEGIPSKISHDPKVIEAYLGVVGSRKNIRAQKQLKN